MGAVHNQLAKGLITETVKRAVGNAKGESGVERFSETLDVVMNPWGMPEWAWLRQELFWSTVTLIGAVVGEVGWFAVSIPLDSQLLMTVDGASVLGAARFSATQVTRALVASTLTVGPRAVCRDQRQGGQNVFLGMTPVETWNGTDPATPTGLGNIRNEEVFGQAADFRTFQQQPLGIIKPGGALVIDGTSLNAAFTCNIWGRVRKAQPGEL